VGWDGVGIGMSMGVTREVYVAFFFAVVWGRGRADWSREPVDFAALALVMMVRDMA
jgi:hypothetical protein